MKTKIGILGSGGVGQTLANGFIKHGYEVMIGSRDTSKLNDWKEQAGNKGQVGSFQEAAAFGETLVLAVKGTAAKDALTLAGKSSLAGKTIIDATNPIADKAPDSGVLHFFTDLNNSLMEQLQNEFAEANFVKAFSSVGAALMVNPQLGGIKPSMFIAGNSSDAKSEVKQILDKFGWETEDMGPAIAARAIEPLCILWCIPGFAQNDWMHAFKVLR
ncbi:MAG TPA: NAD(P)-binding domain-containing protein [Bacteroidales bacterium]|nr:NAD(P)-binding domain-containing protein [Bacteroidales bacterium]HRX95369.1 NAD(P)-binding domain-containing protein [Bacteroidales bacterium]